MPLVTQRRTGRLLLFRTANKNRQGRIASTGKGLRQICEVYEVEQSWLSAQLAVEQAHIVNATFQLMLIKKRAVFEGRKIVVVRALLEQVSNASERVAQLKLLLSMEEAPHKTRTRGDSRSAQPTIRKRQSPR